MSLYRTYRPQSFDDVVGQEHVVATLKQAVEQDKLAHAYLFAGTRGSGKTSIARILAKHLLTRGITDESLRAQLITAIEEGSLIDLTEIDAASNRGIDDIRSLLEKVQFTPVVAAAKVYIIDEAHMLTREAFNALLKTLEEPPAYAYFILATTELHKIPATIQSRCQRFPFRQISEEEMVGRLKYVCEKEKITAEESALYVIARHAQGSLRDALSLLDQLRTVENITEAEVRERAGETGYHEARTLLACIETGDRAGIVSTIRRLEEAAAPFETTLRLLLGALREKLHATIEDATKTATYTTMLNAILQAVVDVRTAPLPALVVEAALLRICATEKESNDAKESNDSKETKTLTAPVIVSTPNTAHTLDLATIRTILPSIIDSIEPASTRMSLKNAQPVELQGNVLLLRFSSAFHRDKALTSESMRTIEIALEKALGSLIKVQGTLEGPVMIASEHEDVDLASAVGDIF